jgi:CheY-like chemotaxis protein
LVAACSPQPKRGRRPEDRRRSLAAGFNLHLSKPVDPGELVLAVANLVGRTD